MKGPVDPYSEPQTPSGQFECDAINTCCRPLLTWSPLCMRSKEGQCDQAVEVKTSLITGDHAVTPKPLQVWYRKRLTEGLYITTLWPQGSPPTK